MVTRHVRYTYKGNKPTTVLAEFTLSRGYQSWPGICEQSSSGEKKEPWMDIPSIPQMIHVCSPPPPSGFSTMLQPAFIFTLLLRDISHINYFNVSLFIIFPRFSDIAFPQTSFSSLCNPLSFKHVTSKLLILKSSNDGPQVISFRGHNYLSPDFQPQKVNKHVFNICILPPDQPFGKYGYC